MERKKNKHEKYENSNDTRENIYRNINLFLSSKRPSLFLVLLLLLFSHSHTYFAWFGCYFFLLSTKRARDWDSLYAASCYAYILLSHTDVVQIFIYDRYFSCLFNIYSIPASSRTQRHISNAHLRLVYDEAHFSSLSLLWLLLCWRYINMWYKL